MFEGMNVTSGVGREADASGMIMKSRNVVYANPTTFLGSIFSIYIELFEHIKKALQAQGIEDIKTMNAIRFYGQFSGIPEA